MVIDGHHHPWYPVKEDNYVLLNLDKFHGGNTDSEDTLYLNPPHISSCLIKRFRKPMLVIDDHH